MKVKSIFKTALAALLAVAVLMSSTVMAIGAENPDYGFTVTKISNPDRTFRMGDGLVEGGDRETSYTWCMADRGDYVYIGTNKNIGGLVADALVAAFKANGIDEETVWTLGNVLTNGEVPRPTTEEGGYILRVSKDTGEIVKLYTAPLNVSFRMAITYGDSVYFGSYAGDAVSSNDILRIDENDNVETVFSSTNGTSMRAACILNDKLYFGGVDESYDLAEGDEGCKKLAILEKDNDDDSVWNRVADYMDFGKRYAADPGVQGNITSPIWDICSYDGNIYATVPNASGFAMFKGHPAADGETANEYGWHWEEVIGFFNGVNNIGLCDDPQGYTGADRGMLSVTATPFVFNDELYVMDFDMTIYSEIYAVKGMITQLLKNTGKPSEYLAGMYATMNHPQSVWKMDNETGEFVKCEGFSKVADNPCTEYLWRTAVYDGELYLGTMDSATIYNYVTRLTNGSFLKMTAEEWRDQLGYIKTMVELFKSKAQSEDVADDADELVEDAENLVTDFDALELDAQSAQDYLTVYQSVNNDVEKTVSAIKEKLEEDDGIAATGCHGPGYPYCGPYYPVTPVVDEDDEDTDVPEEQETEELEDDVDSIKDKIIELYNSIDWEGLRMYAYISNAVKDDVWGFEIFKTADGENYEVVTNDGFGDKYNYGARTLLATDKGLYIGTANPFYGTQLFRLTNNTEPVEDEGIVGDADVDGIISATDVTAIQRDCAQICKLSPIGAKLADICGSGSVSIYDASYIQRWLAEIGRKDAVGKLIGKAFSAIR